MDQLSTRIFRASSLLLLTLLAFPAFSAIIYVDLNVSGGANDGSSWANAYSDLKTALDANPAPGDELWIAQGIYKPDSGTERDSVFSVPSGVALYGGFDGTETARTQRDFVNNVTILSGDLMGDDGPDFANTADNSFTVVLFQSVDSLTTLDGLTISGGNANDTGSGANIQTRNGGAIFNTVINIGDPTKPSLRNCIIKDNQAISSGGAIFNYGETMGGNNSMEITNCTFTNNRADVSGGAIFNDGARGGNSSPDFTKCVFTFNYAGVAGGAIYNDAISNGNSSPRFFECRFEENTVDTTGPISYAGVIYNFGKLSGVSNPLIANCLFARNASFAGGCVYALGTDGGTASPTIINSTFVDNHALQNGGAVYANGSTGTSNMNISNCVFWDNTAQSVFQGFSIRSSGSAVVNIEYSVINANACNQIDYGSGTINCGPGMLYNVDPLFAETTAANYRLSDNSPARDVGDNSAVVLDTFAMMPTLTLTQDLDCGTRILFTTIDLGAYENVNAPLPVELLDFTARQDNDQVELQWTTATEINNAYFTIERSADGIHFEPIERIAGSGTIYRAQTYYTTDEQPLSGLSYYRLKQTDLDGQFTYGPVRSVRFSDLRITAYPNPVAHRLTIALNDFSAGEITYEVYHQQGALVHQGVSELENGLAFIYFEGAQQLQAGSYFIRVYDQVQREGYFKFVKLRE